MHISTSINIMILAVASWVKLRKYGKLMDQSPVYVAALVLNPEHILDYFRIDWEEHPKSISEAEDLSYGLECMKTLHQSPQKPQMSMPRTPVCPAFLIKERGDVQSGCAFWARCEAISVIGSDGF
jgi:hypothetical protein